jgi:hypothetical protein
VSHVHIHSAGTISLSLYVAILSTRLWEYEDIVYHLNMTMNKKFHEEKMRLDRNDASASDLMSEVGRLNATVLTLQEDIALMASNISDLRREVDDLQPHHHLHKPPSPPPPPLASTLPLEVSTRPDLPSISPQSRPDLPSPSAPPVEQSVEERARRLEASVALAFSALTDHAARLACLEGNVTEQSSRWIELDDGGP